MEWISVQNKLPEEKEVVVVYQEWKNAVTLGYWFEMFPNVKFWQALRTPYDAAYDIPWVGAGRVTHWMPLPVPPHGRLIDADVLMNNIGAEEGE